MMAFPVSRIHRASWRSRGVVLLTVFSLLTGCGEIAFKRGGNAQGLEAAQRQCRAEHADDAAYESCLKAVGWYTAAMAGADSAIPQQANTATAAASATPPSSFATASPEAPRSGGLSAAVSAPHGLALSSPAPIARDTDILVVGSWWKLGGNAGGLDVDLLACEGGTLKRQQISRAAFACMRGRGWVGIAGTAPAAG